MTPQQRPISGGQINKHVELLKQILEPYVGGELDSNPVVVGDHHIEYGSAKDWKIQPDEIVSLLNASASLDVAVVQPQSRRLRGACVSLRRDGLTYAQIASKLGIVEGTVGYHLRRQAHVAAPVMPMYRALIHVLLIAGLRISEALALRCEDIDLFHLNIYVEESKTDAGRREVHIHEPLEEVLLAYKEARGDAWTKGSLAFGSRNGTPLSRHNVARRTMPRLVEEANKRARPTGSWPNQGARDGSRNAPRVRRAARAQHKPTDLHADAAGAQAPHYGRLDLQLRLRRRIPRAGQHRNDGGPRSGRAQARRIAPPGRAAATNRTTDGSPAQGQSDEERAQGPRSAKLHDLEQQMLRLKIVWVVGDDVPQVGRAERCQDLEEHGHRQVALSPLDVAEIAARDPSAKRKGFLRQPCRAARGALHARSR